VSHMARRSVGGTGAPGDRLELRLVPNRVEIGIAIEKRLVPESAFDGGFQRVERLAGLIP
jgi:hypothetical protein